MKNMKSMIVIEHNLNFYFLFMKIKDIVGYIYIYIIKNILILFKF